MKNFFSLREEHGAGDEGTNKLVKKYKKDTPMAEEAIDEVLTKDTDLGKWIADFIKSDNPKFDGKSAEERKKMATAAYYAAQKEGFDKTTQSADKKPENYTDKDGKTKVRMVPTKQDVQTESVEKHRVQVTISDPNHTMATKRKEQIQKHIRVSADDHKQAVDKATAHYKKQGYKVHGAEHVGMVKEEVELDEMTQGKSYTQKQLQSKIQSGNWEATHDIKPGKHVEMRHHSGKRVTVHVKEYKSSVSENTKQIDELSKSTLGSYKAQATGQAMTHHAKVHMSTDADTIDKHSKAAHKRMVGAAKAHQKMTKESTDICPECLQDPCVCGGNHITELTNNTVSSYRTAAHRDVNKRTSEKPAHELPSKDYEHKMKVRSKGITKADSRLGTHKNSKLDISGNADSVKKFGTNESYIQEELELTEDAMIELFNEEMDGYEGEGSTVRDQLAYIKYAVEDLLDMLDDEEDESEVDEWATEKLNKAFVEIYEIYEYLSSEDEDEDEEDEDEE